MKLVICFVCKNQLFRKYINKFNNLCFFFENSPKKVQIFQKYHWILQRKAKFV